MGVQPATPGNCQASRNGDGAALARPVVGAGVGARGGKHVSQGAGRVRAQARRHGGGAGVLPSTSAHLLRGAEIRGARKPSFGKSARRCRRPGMEGTRKSPTPLTAAASPIRLRCGRCWTPSKRPAGRKGLAWSRCTDACTTRCCARRRPSSLLLDECDLPDEGWGLLEFSEIRSAAGREWTDDGEVHETRKPKGGPRNAVRSVPIPPVLVRMLREHIEDHGTAPDGRLFRTYRGGIYLPSTLWSVLQKARRAAHRGPGRFAAGAQAVRLPARGGLLAAERRNTRATRRRVGRSHGRGPVRIYAHCLDGDDERWFGRLEDALGDD